MSHPEGHAMLIVEDVVPKLMRVIGEIKDFLPRFKSLMLHSGSHHMAVDRVRSPPNHLAGSTQYNISEGDEPGIRQARFLDASSCPLIHVRMCKGMQRPSSWTHHLYALIHKLAPRLVSWSMNANPRHKIDNGLRQSDCKQIPLAALCVQHAAFPRALRCHF